MSSLKKITSVEDLEIGRYYYCEDKKTGEKSISRVNSINAKKYIKDRIWEEPNNNQALEKYNIVGPISIPDLKAWDSSISIPEARRIARKSLENWMKTKHTNAALTMADQIAETAVSKIHTTSLDVWREIFAGESIVIALIEFKMHQFGML